MKPNVIKVIGIIASAVGVVASLASSWANEKQTDIKIAEKVAEAVANIGTKES